MKLRNFLALLFCLIIAQGYGQIVITDSISEIDYANPHEYEIGGITVSGVQYFDNSVLIMLSGLNVGDKITVPGESISESVKKLWKQGLFDDIKISVSKIYQNIIFLDIYLQERPRLSKFSFTGVKKSEADKIREEIKLVKGDLVTENLIIRTENKIIDYFVGKGYFNATVNITQQPDTSLSNTVLLTINVDKKKRVKIAKINFSGNEEIPDGKLQKAMKKTKKKKIYRIFSTSKFLEDEYKNDKIGLIDKYNEMGYRDAKILKDSIYRIDPKHIGIDILIEEGQKYYFRNITWVGNTKYSNEQLNNALKIKKGDVYNQTVLDANLSFNLNSTDVRSLYMDDGYLFFNVIPVEIAVENDSIDLEIRIYEGKQAIINKIIVTGNTKTNDHVIMREIRTKPGQLFNRSDIIRTQRELAQLRYFDQEKLGVNPKPNPVDGTVDIEYVVEETSTDQIELSGGWGLGRVVGTLGLSFNNFSMRNIFKKGAWIPLPSGDGQKLSLRAQSNGIYYQAYNASFTEPWLGGKKPNAFSITLFHSVYTNGLKKDDPSRYHFKIDGIMVGLGKRLTWPDDYFTRYLAINIQSYSLKNYSIIQDFNNGSSNNISCNLIIARNSLDAPIYPRTGSDLSLSIQATPPYSIFSGKDYSTASAEEKFKWVEYHKWKVNTSWFTKLAGNLVLNTRAKYGFIGLYNRDLGITPFERYYVGGDGLSGIGQFDGRELIGMRGYSNNSLTPRGAGGEYLGGTIYNKYTLELRFPISLNPMATVWLHGFFEAGNAWTKFNDFNPFDVRRSAGFGVRINLQMFGLLGLDWGYGFDNIPGDPTANKGQFHFSINQSID